MVGSGWGTDLVIQYLQLLMVRHKALISLIELLVTYRCFFKVTLYLGYLLLKLAVLFEQRVTLRLQGSVFHLQLSILCL